MVDRNLRISSTDFISSDLARTMICPFCHQDNDHVVDSRSMAEGTAIRRRRECLACGKRFTTYEHIEEIPLTILKRDGTREAFNRDKIASGIRRATQKRGISEDQVQEITSAIEKKIFAKIDKDIPSTVVGECVMEQLRDLDQVAYVRFASVYRSFKDVTEFMDELSELLERPGAKNEKKSGSGKGKKAGGEKGKKK
jgi:transcriptional repressor NrdR